MAKRDPGYEKAFETAFKAQFRPLHAYACSFLDDEAQAEDIVQQVFLKLWEKQDSLSITSLKPYLYRSVHNACINQFQRRKQSHAYNSYLSQQTRHEEKMTAVSKETEGRIMDAINQLPAQCRLIFQLSRFEELKYREIADELRLSVKTVEAQMSKALTALRSNLSDLLLMLLIILINQP